MRPHGDKRKTVLEKRALDLERKQQDRAYKSKKRALESHDETLERRKQNRACTARKRAAETQEETLHYALAWKKTGLHAKFQVHSVLKWIWSAL